MYFDYHQNLLITQRNKIDLDELRAYLLVNERTLCLNHFIKAIKVRGETVLTYDWEHIMSIAEQKGIVSIFIKTKLN